MRILLDNGTYDLHNVGDIAMLQVAVTRLRQYIPGCKLRVFCNDPDRLAQLIPDVEAVPQHHRNAVLTPFAQVGPLRRLFPSGQQPALARWERALRVRVPRAATYLTSIRALESTFRKQLQRSLQLLDETDVVILSGGGYLCDTFHFDTERKLEYIAIAAALGKTTAMFSQGLGPLTDKGSLRLASTALRRCKLICLREGIAGREILRSLGVVESQLCVTGDDAIELARNQAAAETRDAIGFNFRISGNLAFGPEDAASAQEYLDRMGKLTGLRIQPIPISFLGPDSDLDTFRRCFEFEADGTWDHVSSPADAVRLVSSCRIVVTSAYHVAVFAMSHGIPSVMLAKSDYYLAKHIGLAACFKNRLCRVVKFANADSWREVELATMELLRFAECRDSELLHHADEQIAQQHQAYLRFADGLVSRRRHDSARSTHTIHHAGSTYVRTIKLDGLIPTQKHRDLVYDVGIHHGEDTDFYLRKGYRVIAFEADPECVRFCKARFADFIDHGQLKIVEGAIIESKALALGQTTVAFYKNEQNPVWGTVCHDWMERNERLGAPSGMIEVAAVDFERELQTHGVPYYMKIDIEGCDRVCLEALQRFRERPDYVSLESDKTSFANIKREIDLLASLGYDAFQAVEQSQIPSSQVAPNPPSEGQYAAQSFELGCSGLFGRELGGQWKSRREILRLYRAIRWGYMLLGDDGIMNEWYFRGSGRLKSYAWRFVNHFTRSAVPGWYDTHARHANAERWCTSDVSCSTGNEDKQFVESAVASTSSFT